MEARYPVLLDVWREVCRHVEIQAAAERIAAQLAGVMPIHDLLLRRFDLRRSCIETVSHAAREHAPDWPPRTECPSELVAGLLAWCRANGMVRTTAAAVPPPLRLALPAQLRGDVMVGVLTAGEGPIGLAVIAAGPHGPFDPGHEALFQELLEPLSVAMQNDARVHEIATLRDAAEADRRSLLTRLGRQEISEVIVGADNGLRQVMERARLVASSDAPVLLFGETGSGKEVVAREIHRQSPRSTGPFLRVNCGAIPQDLIDSELFGHEKGSFTGATNLRKGWFERADQGTLFLDEVGELPPAAQVRLLRILQDGTFERVGGQRQLHVDVRIVAATHRNLQAMVADGRFREDLWYRIAVFPIFLPALRDRPEDIPELAAHFALKSARRFGLTSLAPTTDDLHLLISYPWPGNVRELGAVMDRAVILGNGQRLEIAKALGATQASASPIPPNPAALGAAGVASEPRFLTLDAAMRQHIELALAKCSGRVEGPNGAAKLLALNPYTLRGRMRKLGIDWARYRPAGA